MPRRSQEERTRSTRSALTSAARALFAERGYGAVSTDGLREAVAVYRGELLPGFYHEWVLRERERLEAGEEEVAE